MTISPRVAWQVIGGSAVLLDLDGKRALGLNDAGTFLWPLLADHDEDALAAALVREFDVDVDQAHADVRAFLGLLAERGFLTLP